MLLEEVIHEKKGQYFQVEEKSQITESIDILAFIDEEYIDDYFFNGGLLDKLENLTIMIVVIGFQKKLRGIPPQVHCIHRSVFGKKNILQAIEVWQRYRQNLNKREQALAIKLNRLFYIYHVLYEGEYLFMEDILKMTRVSKRTIMRDIKTLRDVLVTKEIVFDESKGAYFMDEIRK
jgi:hypothetical protein